MTITAAPAVPNPSSPTFGAETYAFTQWMAAAAAEMDALGVELNAALVASMAGVTATSTTSLTIGAGSKPLTVEAGKGFVIGQTLKVASSADPANAMIGVVTAYNNATGALTVLVAADGVSGSGTLAAWSISVSTVAVAQVGFVPIGGMIAVSGQGNSFTDHLATFLKTGVIAVASAYPSATPFTLADAATWVARTGVSATWGRGGTHASSASITVITSSASVTTYMTTTDGITFTSRVFPTAGTWRVAYGNGIFLAVNYDASATTAYTSTDGINWTSRTITANATSYGKPVFGDGLFVIPAGNTAWLATADGITYTAVTGIAAAVNANSGSAFGNGTFVVIGTSGAVLVSQDGLSWNSVAAITAVQLRFGNGHFVLLSSLASGAIATSVDGASWVSATPPVALGVSAAFPDFAFGNGVFLFANGASSATHYKTSDFITWTAVTVSSATLWDMAFFSSVANAFGLVDSGTTTATTSVTSGSYVGSPNAVFAGGDTTKPYYMRVA